MIESIKVTNYRDESITLTLKSPEESGFYVKKIAGLDPPKATIIVNESLDFDGGSFNSARATYRNILLTLGFLPDASTSVEDLRQKTYRYFPLKRKVTLLITTTNRELEIEGYVEDNNVDIFSKQSGTLISIICPDAYFKTINSILTVFVGIEEFFEFPFSNESLTEPRIEFGLISLAERKDVVYDGDTETGIIITAWFDGTVDELVIYNLLLDQSFSIDDTRLETILTSGFSLGDKLVISTIRGEKSMVVTRGGVDYNILTARGTASDWLTVAKGNNDFFFSASVGEELIRFEIEHHPIYQGV